MHEKWVEAHGYVERSIPEVAEDTEWPERSPQGYETEHFRSE
jgi:hypothetical protein